MFHDFRVGGAVHTILVTLLEGATARGLVPIEKLFQNDSQFILPILFEIEAALIAVSSSADTYMSFNQTNLRAEIALFHSESIFKQSACAAH